VRAKGGDLEGTLPCGTKARLEGEEAPERGDASRMAGNRKKESRVGKRLLDERMEFQLPEIKKKRGGNVSPGKCMAA